MNQMLRLGLFVLIFNTTGYAFQSKFNSPLPPDTIPLVVYNCPTDMPLVPDTTMNDMLLWNAPYWLNPQTNMSDLCEAPSDLHLTATESCTGNGPAFRYQLFLDLDGDNVRETVVDSDDLPPSNTVYFNNASGGGQARAFDFRTVPADEKWQFALEVTGAGDTKTAYVRFNTIGSPNTYDIPQLPHGNHKIKWYVTDECGNETVCEYTFRVRDIVPPTVVCVGLLSVSYPPNCILTIYASDFLQSSEDNCTPNQYLFYGVRKAGTGTGFPIDGNGNPLTSITFTGSELGLVAVELWAIDWSGNAAYCETTVLVQDHLGICGDVSYTLDLDGHIKTESNKGIAGVNVSVSGTPGNFAPPFNYFGLTDTSGHWKILNALPFGASNVSIQPGLDGSPLNGVTVYDLVLISKHILAIEPLNSPYKLIAADANKSNSITTFDIVELRKLILGILQELPSYANWQFVPKSFVFPNLQNPFQTPVPGTISIPSLLSDVDSLDFIGIKIGDVNNSAIVNATGPADERSAGTIGFYVSTNTSEAVRKGDEFDVSFASEQELSGCQFTLNTYGLEVLDIHPGTNMERDHFALFPEKNALTMAWEKGGAAAFSLKCKALESGNLREMLSISNRITTSEAYRDNTAGQTERFDLTLSFPEMTTFELFQNRPNPFGEATEIAFNLPEASEATLTVFDANSRVLFVKTGDYGRGMNAIRLEKSVLDAMGVLYYRLETGTDNETKKMLKM